MERADVDATEAQLCRELNAPHRAADLSHALHLADEVSPSPAKAHTALLVLRDALARATRSSVDGLLQRFPIGTKPSQD